MQTQETIKHVNAQMQTQKTARQPHRRPHATNPFAIIDGDGPLSLPPSSHDKLVPCHQKYHSVSSAHPIWLIAIRFLKKK